jgi:hypothetical protein
MQPITFCSRCRGMVRGWNRRYVLHSLRCKAWISNSSKLLIVTVFLFVVAFELDSAQRTVFSGTGELSFLPQTTFIPPTILEPVPEPISPAVHMMDAFLRKFQVKETHRTRVAESIVRTSRKYKLDPRLIASIMIVESRANPFAVSHADAIGVMQVHLPTWGRDAEKEGINLFRIEDNIDFGVRILKDYVRRFGLWEGVKHYKGWNAEDPQSLQSAHEYVAKVQNIYSRQRETTASPQ